MIIKCLIAALIILWYLRVLRECMRIADEEVDAKVRLSVKIIFVILSPIIIPWSAIKGFINGLRKAINKGGEHE